MRLLAGTLLAGWVVASFASAGPAAAAGSGVWPLDPRPPVVRGFEPPPKPWLPGHRGVDLLGSPGQQVRAAAAGTVVFAGVLAGRGVVVVSHGATRTTYEPVVATVRAGSWVTAGGAIGTLSGAAGHCPPRACLHWGLLRGDVYLDPLTLVAATPVRLLPIGAGRAQVAPAEQPPTSLHSGGVSRAVEPREPTPSVRGSTPTARAVVGLAALVVVGAGVLVSRH
jgi:murein DD-endopeptidase MepM/ murein hydrolase activator NlpD